MSLSFCRLLPIVLLALTLAPLCAQEELPPLPSNETLARLLSYESGAFENQISIGVVVRGEAELGRKFKSEYAIHVTFIWPVSDRGRRVRKSDSRIFLWNEAYGWFTYVEGTRRGTAVIDVCSEHLGMIEIK